MAIQIKEVNMRLIDADFLKRKCVNMFIDDEDILGMIDEAPTVVTSRWIPVSDRLPAAREKGYGNKQKRVEVIACQRNRV